MKLFKSKIDTWLALIVFATSATSLLIAFYVAVTMGGAGIPIFAFIFLSGVIFPLWLYFRTYYSISDGTLKIKCGPFSWTVPIDSITSVRETRNPLSSPAWSLDRLQIIYGNGKSVMVSPKDKQGFLHAINQNI